MEKSIKPHRIIIALSTILILYIGMRCYNTLSYKNTTNKEYSTLKENLSLEDKINKNTYWSANFNLLWNALTEKVEIANIGNTNIKNNKLIDNLNKKTFTKKNLNSNSYYINQGYTTKELKNQIEKNLKKKFDITSSFIEDFEWDDSQYLLYTILYKDLQFKENFQKIDNEMFKNQDNVAYFGIKTSGTKKVRSQIKVLYYQDINNFAVKLLTTSDDEIILSRGNKGFNFLEIYQDIKAKEEKFEGSKEFRAIDELKIPIIEIHNYEEIKALKDLQLKSDKEDIKIDKIIREISLKLDVKGEKIKDKDDSQKTTTSLDKNARLFYLTSDFNMFLIEKNKDLPYFAINISDISKFQSTYK